MARSGKGNLFGLDMKVFGYSDAVKRMIARADKTADAAREFVREAGRIVVRALQFHAPKRTNIFAQGIYYRTFQRADGYEIRFYAGGEHGYVMRFLRDGTVAHTIPTGGSAAQLAKGYPLRFFWQNGPNGPGIYRYWSVQHPGTQKSPFVEQAKATSQAEVRTALKNLVHLAWL